MATARRAGCHGHASDLNSNSSSAHTLRLRSRCSDIRHMNIPNGSASDLRPALPSSIDAEDLKVRARPDGTRERK